MFSFLLCCCFLSFSSFNLRLFHFNITTTTFSSSSSYFSLGAFVFFLLVPLLVDVVAYCCCVIEYYSLYELVAQHHTLILSHSLSTFASVRSFLYLLLLLFRRIYEHIRAERVLICIAFLFIFFLQMKTWCPGSGSKRKPYIIEKCVPSAESY